MDPSTDDVTYFDCFGAEHVPKEIKTFIGHSLSITTNIFRIQAYDSMMWNDDIILNYFNSKV